MERDIKRLRRWMIRKRLQGWPVLKICSYARVHKDTFYYWWTRFIENGGPSFEEERSRRPHAIHRTPDHIKERILDVRRTTELNENAIQAKLAGEGISVGHATIYRTLKEHGLIKSLKQKRRQRTYRSWQREHPNSLWQTDLCFYKTRWLSTFIDDCSRYVVGIRLFREGTSGNILELFGDAIDNYGRPTQVLTDHGCQFWSAEGRTSAFSAFCREQGIQHILGGIGKPTTLGKIERFHRTFREIYPRFNDLDAFIQYYNHERPHRGLGYKTPAYVYSIVSEMS